ncbi:uncharacterized protein IL334_002042 [Kwoniella shivajii]|uniref:Uncharacterized protein n=1 Tax=Kwoniella shivajii TaxID=564305 RepID=A0ABZ1CTY6_9TREE|nr:hypothetical protein IL334_002042 [Kwoniella shivajii]
MTVTSITSISQSATLVSTSSDMSTTTSMTTSSSITSSDSASVTASPSPSSDTNGLSIETSKQPSSIRYLVPVFLLIFITMAGFAYQKYRKRKKRRSRNSMAGKDFEKMMKNNNDPFMSDKDNRGWKEIPTYENDDIWDDTGIDNQPQLHWQDGLNPSNTSNGLIRSGGLISAGQKGWGWKESWNDFKSARGKQYHEQENRMEEKTTMKLVNSCITCKSTFTLPSQNQGDYHEVSIEGEEGELGERSNQHADDIKLLRDKLSSLTYNPSKDIPETPEYLRPRSVSPTNVLSPPMQPHLFFHPSPLPPGNSHEMAVSEYSDNDTATIMTNSVNNTPNPDLISSPKVTPTPSPSKGKLGVSKMPRIPSTASGLAGADFFSVVSPNRLSTSCPPSKSKEIGPSKTPMRYTPSGLNPTSSNASPSKSALTLKRSIAVKNLASPSRLSPNPNTSLSPKISKKSRVQKKEAKARNEVEDILKASWSDRALTSPPIGSVTVPGMMSPGLEETNGIEQRLALLKGVEI